MSTTVYLSAYEYRVGKRQGVSRVASGPCLLGEPGLLEVIIVFNHPGEGAGPTAPLSETSTSSPLGSPDSVLHAPGGSMPQWPGGNAPW